MNNNLLNKPIALSNLIWIVLVLILLVSNVFFIYKYYGLKKESVQNQVVIQSQAVNDKVLEFTKLFVSKVLKTNSEIDFETRLSLENTVRDLKDEEVLAQWQKFTNSKTQEEAQVEVKSLLEMLVNKIK